MSGFIHRIQLSDSAPVGKYPFSLPVLEKLREDSLTVSPGVTFFVGENGSGKSTLIEGIAVASGLNAEGGSQNNRFSTRSSESSLGSFLTLVKGSQKPRSKFFLRAESFYNLATETELLGPEQAAVFGGASLHELSHGESFISVMANRFYPRGLYIMDEPEAALSPQGCITVLSLMADLVREGCQLIVATHSPILLALPGALIYEIDTDGEIVRREYVDAMPVQLTRSFLDNPERFLRHLTPE